MSKISITAAQTQLHNVHDLINFVLVWYVNNFSNEGIICAHRETFMGL